MPNRGRYTFEVTDRPLAGIEVEDLPQSYVQRTNAAAHGSGQRAFDGNAKITNGFHRIVREPFLECIESLFTGENFVPCDLALAAISMLDGRVENAPRSFPDVAAGAIAFDERDDRVVRNLQLAPAVFDRRSVCRNGMPVVTALHVAYLQDRYGPRKDPSGYAASGAYGRIWKDITSCGGAETWCSSKDSALGEFDEPKSSLKSTGL